MTSANAAPSARTRPTPRAGVMAIEAYVPGKSSAPAGVKLVKLSSNETPLGPSPGAIAAFKALADKGINIQVISTSEIKVSVLIPVDYTELAVRALHTAYGLDGPEPARRAEG